MRVFKTKGFEKFAAKGKLTDEMLLKAAKEIEDGLIDAELGGQLFKKRIASPGQGKSTSYRTILAYKKEVKLFFLYGFSKSQIENINTQEKKALKIVARELMSFNEEQLGIAKSNEALFEIEVQDE